MKVLVTGATGLLGSNLIRILLRRRHSVTAFVQPGTCTSTINGLAVTKAEGNILDFKDLLTAAQGADAICHLAANTSVWPERCRSIREVNIEGTRNAVNVGFATGIQRFVHVGTANSFSYGNKTSPGKEGTPYRCSKFRLDYMDSKYQAQQIVQKAVSKGLPAVIVNPTFMFGPYDSRPSSGQMLIALDEGKIIGYTQGGKNYICAKDAAIGVANALTKGRIGESYILGNENLTYKEAFAKMVVVMAKKPPRLPLAQWIVIPAGFINSVVAKITGKKPSVSLAIARISCEEHYYSAQKAVQELDLPQTPIEEGIREAYNWLKKNKKQIQ